MNLQNIPAVQGHIDSSFDDDRWMGSGAPDASRYTFWFLGDDPDGPAVFCVTAPPNPSGKETSAHSHSADQVRVVLEGSFKVGNKWYHAGEMRVQDKGRIYGPEVVGPEGCRYLVVFEKRSAIVPKFVKAALPENAAIIAGLTQLIAPACGQQAAVAASPAA
jgi:anti-sigma factor ChrR (cupin superfamily)